MIFVDDCSEKRQSNETNIGVLKHKNPQAPKKETTVKAKTPIRKLEFSP